MKTAEELEVECSELKWRLEALQKNYDQHEEWLLEWKRVAESLKASQPNFISLMHKLEHAEKCCVKLRDALTGILNCPAEPIGGAYAMQDIAHAALKENA